MNRWMRAKYQPNLPAGVNGEYVTASKEHIALSREAAREGMVLLKNEGGILPLKDGTRIALFGKGTFDYVKGGGGSGDVETPYIHNIYDAFSAVSHRVMLYDGTLDFYKKYVRDRREAGDQPGMMKEPALSDEMVKDAAAYADVAVISISRFSGEGWDRVLEGDNRDHFEEIPGIQETARAVFPDGDFNLTREESAMVEKVSNAFSKVVVLLNVGGMVDSGWFYTNDKIPAVLLTWQGGMEGADAAVELLMGDATPSGHLSDTFAENLMAYPSTKHFHDSDDYVVYEEDIFVGYRYFSTIPGADRKVNYPFGYGLSYTDFSVKAGEVELAARDDLKNAVIRVDTEITNIGSYNGKEVLQLYVKAPEGKLTKAARSLVSYKKTRLLAPGDSQRIRFNVPLSAFASYDDEGAVAKSAWVLEAGSYEFYLGANVRDAVRLEGALELSEDLILCQVKERIAPTRLNRRMVSDGTLKDTGIAWSESCDFRLNGRAMAKKLAGPMDPNTGENHPEPMVLTDCYSPAERERESRALYGPESMPKHAMLSDVAEGKVSMEEFVKLLSDEDLCWLLGGQPNTGVGVTYGMGNNPEFGIPNLMTADGPAGLRVLPEMGVKTTAFPCATLLACSFNDELVEKLGEAAGAEVKENNLSMWLTPALCIHRSPLCGRNFEYYSEDPYLSGKIAAALIRGIQKNGISACPKHFALNNKETNRKNSDSIVSERAAREIYLKGFEILVKESDPWCIMSSYNSINGVRAAENGELLNGILREEWGYEGLVTTDWWNNAEEYMEKLAGNDIKMGCGYPKRLLSALHNQLVDRKTLEDCAKSLLTYILRVE